jgi:hypothetical protein
VSGCGIPTDEMNANLELEIGARRHHRALKCNATSDH